MALDPTKATAMANAIEDLIDNTLPADLHTIIDALRGYSGATALARKAGTLPEVSAELTTDKTNLFTEMRTLMGI